MYSLRFKLDTFCKSKVRNVNVYTECWYSLLNEPNKKWFVGVVYVLNCGWLKFYLPDSDTNSHNEEPRSSGPVVITRAVINIKSNGEAITEATKPKVLESSKPLASNGNTKLTRNRRLTKKTIMSSSSNASSSSSKCPKNDLNSTLIKILFIISACCAKNNHIYQGLKVLEDITDEDETDCPHPVEEEASRLKSCLDRAKNSISFLKERERKLKDR